jgi:1-pyrroline-5-carboxylate dehydrogenase
MSNSIYRVPPAVNEPISSFAPGTVERASLQAKLTEMSADTVDIPIIINGKEIRTGNTANCVMPHNHGHVLGSYHKAGEKEVQMAIEASINARQAWAEMPWEARVAIFKKMASLLQGPFRDIINAATMLGQSKNAFQAEIDAACELIDFFNFNCEYVQQIYTEQPPYSPDGMWNQVEYRGLEGFVFAVTPFNFTSIAANLPTAPALMGNAVVWKPASSSVYSGYFLMKLFKAAGLPDGVINFVPGSGAQVGDPVMESEHLAGIHFTGSTAVFQGMWKKVGENIHKYKTYPRIVGETGGKDFILAHPSSEVDGLVTAMIRGAYEYQGQKCSAASRCYIPSDLWDEVKTKFVEQVATIKMGDVSDFSNFVNAVIDEAAFDSITSYIDYAKNADDADIICGGVYDKSTGYFVEPTAIVTTNPHFKTMEEEIFGPVLTIYVYDWDDSHNDKSWEDICKVVDSTSEYALTGAIFSRCRETINAARRHLVHAAGNFYINDKPTGAVVGQQPFGGSRASGTNDKAGSAANLMRWVSQRTVKETFVPPIDYRYPFLETE